DLSSGSFFFLYIQVIFRHLRSFIRTLSSSFACSLSHSTQGSGGRVLLRLSFRTLARSLLNNVGTFQEELFCTSVARGASYDRSKHCLRAPDIGKTNLGCL